MAYSVSVCSGSAFVTAVSQFKYQYQQIYNESENVGNNYRPIFTFYAIPNPGGQSADKNDEHTCRNTPAFLFLYYFYKLRQRCGTRHHACCYAY
jgi:hypothetical protein